MPQVRMSTSWRRCGGGKRSPAKGCWPQSRESRQMSPPLTLFHVSDLHFGAEDRAALDWFAQGVKDVQPDAVICTGDLTMRARHGEYAAAAAWLGALAAPVMVEPGNHDLPYFNLIERFTAPYARYRALR